MRLAHNMDERKKKINNDNKNNNKQVMHNSINNNFFSLLHLRSHVARSLLCIVVGTNEAATLLLSFRQQ